MRFRSAFLAGWVLLTATSSPAQDRVPTELLRPGSVVVDDMVFTEESRKAYYGSAWADGIVPYRFDEPISETHRESFRWATRLLESVADLTFIELGEGEDAENYLEVIQAGGNWSYVGPIGGRQPLSMLSWYRPYTIVHELIHALGFLHEQSRADRDDYVTIRFENMIDGVENNFLIAETAEPLRLCLGVALPPVGILEERSTNHRAVAPI